MQDWLLHESASKQLGFYGAGYLVSDGVITKGKLIVRFIYVIEKCNLIILNGQDISERIAVTATLSTPPKTV